MNYRLKNSLILKQHMPYAAMISKAIDFSEWMLSNTDTLYPFAVLTIGNDLQCVFAPADGQEATAGMIEELGVRLAEQKIYAEEAAGVLVYSATVCASHQQNELQGGFKEETDAIVLTITDSAGKNTVTIYPYSRTPQGINISKPYTCDFSD
mgnify:CR=1 FL=1